MSIPVPSPGDSVEIVEMTEERKEKYATAVAAVFRALKAEGLRPLEGYAVLDLAMDYLRDTYHIKSVMRSNDGEVH